MKEHITRIDLIKNLPKNLNCLEIGVFKAEFSDEILENMNPLKLYLVDIWSGQMASGDKDGNNSILINDMNSIFLELKEKYKNNSVVKLVKNDSNNFLQSMPDNYFDFIYIDADHRYDAVYNDLMLSFLKIKNEGFLCGHDYNPNSDVRRAVDNFCSEFNQNISEITKDGCPSFLINVKK